MTAIERVSVALPGRAYDILVGPGLLDAVGAEVRATLPARKVAILTDRTVAGLYLARVRESLVRAGLVASEIVVEPGEGSKSFAVLAEVIDTLLDQGIERRDAVLALGGGVVGDLAGLAASLLRRGVPVVQCPTTLLAQVDSSVGGKTGIDTRHGKNLVGTFHQPARVLADTRTLESLPARELRAGYAEIVKYGLIDDAAFFAWCEREGGALLAGAEPLRREAVLRACAAKARVVVADEREDGPRALLNLGHTFGHALEAATGFGTRLLHGEAVAIGMAMAFALSAARGLAPPADAERVRRHLAAAGLPTAPREISGPPLSPDLLLHHMMQDKKIVGGVLSLVLVRGIGQAFLTRDVPADAVRDFLAHYA